MIIIAKKEVITMTIPSNHSSIHHSNQPSIYPHSTHPLLSPPLLHLEEVRLHVREGAVEDQVKVLCWRNLEAYVYDE